MERDPHLPAHDEELSNFFDDLRKFWDNLGTPILLLIVIGSFGYLAWSLLTYNREVSRDEAWTDLAGSTSPASFEQVADDHGNPTVAQLAWLRAADLYLDEAADAEGEARAEKLDEAEALYQRVVDEAEHNEFKINGLEGLAIVAEGKRDMELARQRNQAVIDLAKEMPGFDTWSSRAAVRMSILPDLETPVRFVDDPNADAGQALLEDANAIIDDAVNAATDGAAESAPEEAPAPGE